MIYSSPSMSPDGTRVFVGSDDGFMYALDSATGTLAWKVDAGYPNVGIDSSLAVSADSSRLFFGSYDKHVYALDLSSQT